MPLSCLGVGKNPTKEHLLALAKKHGLKQSEETILEVQKAVGMWNTFAKCAGVSGQTESTIEKVLKEIAKKAE